MTALSTTLFGRGMGTLLRALLLCAGLLALTAQAQDASSDNEVAAENAAASEATASEASDTAQTAAEAADANANANANANAMDSAQAGTDDPAASALQTTAPRYLCTLDSLERRVEVAYQDPPNQVPCEVQYFKDKEAPTQKQVLWNASNEVGYCEAQAESFVEKLRGWGWNCEAL